MTTPMTRAMEAREAIASLVAFNWPKSQIARSVGVTPVTLSRWLARAAIDEGHPCKVAKHTEPNAHAMAMLTGLAYCAPKLPALPEGWGTWVHDPTDPWKWEVTKKDGPTVRGSFYFPGCWWHSGTEGTFYRTPEKAIQAANAPTATPPAVQPTTAQTE